MNSVHSISKRDYFMVIVGHRTGDIRIFTPLKTSLRNYIPLNWFLFFRHSPRWHSYVFGVNVIAYRCIGKDYRALPTNCLDNVTQFYRLQSPVRSHTTNSTCFHISNIAPSLNNLFKTHNNETIGFRFSLLPFFSNVHPSCDMFQAFCLLYSWPNESSRTPNAM